MTCTRRRPNLLKFHDGKTHLVPRLRELLPDHLTYVEPYCGAAALLLAKDPARSEVINDCCVLLGNLWRVVRDPKTFGPFRRLCQLTPFSQRVVQVSGSEFQFHE